MTHFSQAELVDWLEGALPALRASHLDECARCREEADELRQVMEDAARIAVPEPSPLFWDHLSARVTEAVAATPPPHAAAWAQWIRRRGPVAAAAVGCLLLAFALLRVSGSLAPTEPVLEPPALEADEAAPTLPGTAADEAWSLVQMVADDVPLQEAQDAGLVAQPGSAERMALELSARERAELAVLLQHELKGSGL